MTTQEAKNKFQEIFGKVDLIQFGYDLKAIRIKSGILVIKTYQRNSWVDAKVEKKVLFHKNGKIYENHKEIKI